MTRQQNIALICVIAVLAIVLVAVGGYFIDTYSSSDGERRSGGFVYSSSGNTATIIAYEGDDTTITIPARIAGRRVAYVEEGFLDGTSVTEVIFSEDITKIELEEGIFADNTKLTYVSLPDSLTEVPASAFENCTSLTRVKLPSSLQTIGNSAFEGCTNLETSGADGESDFVIPDSVTEVGEDAFMDCGDLTRVTIGTGLKEIPKNMFDNCDSINTLVFAEGSTVERIGENAFRDNNLGNVTLPDSLKYIGVSAFENNDSASFNRIVIPAGVVTVSNYAFRGCSRLATVEFGSEGETVELTGLGKGVFMNCTRLATISLPETVTEIPELAFYGCKYLAKFTIGAQIETIGDGAFSGGVGSEASGTLSFNCLASGYQLVQLPSYTYFGSNLDNPVTRDSHWLLTDSTGSVVYSYIGSYDPEDCNNRPGLTEYSDSVNTSFYFLMDLALEQDIIELRPYALAGVKGRINIPTTVETIGAFCFKDCTPEEDGSYLNIFIGNTSCEVDEEAFDETGITGSQTIQVLIPDTNSALNDAVQSAIDDGNRNWIDVVRGSAVR